MSGYEGSPEDRREDMKGSMRRGGRFAALAKRAGMSPKAFADANIHATTEVGKLARMWYLAQGTHGGGEANMGGAGDERTLAQKLYQVG